MTDNFELQLQRMSKIKDVGQLPPLVMAYVGDAVFDLYVRTRLVTSNSLTGNKLHRETVKYVKAKAQAVIAKIVYNDLTDEERAIFRRGRNAKTPTVPKNADISDYHYATAFETVIGYIYLNKNMQRLDELLIKAVQVIEMEKHYEGKKTSP